MMQLRLYKGEHAWQLAQDVHNPAEYEAKIAALYDALIPRVSLNGSCIAGQ
jgi:hypothetical protein